MRAAEGWYRDPFGVHEHRWFSTGRPTQLVRDHGTEAADPPPEPDYAGVLEAIEPPTSDARDLRRADRRTRVNQSFNREDGPQAALRYPGL